MQNTELARLKLLFSSAAYNYLHITNLAEQAQLFLSTGNLPDFLYKDYLNGPDMEKRKEKILSEMATAKEPESLVFLQRRLEETDLLILIATGDTKSSGYSDLYRGYMKLLYSEPSVQLFSQALRYIVRRSQDTHTESYLLNILDQFLISPADEELFVPSDELFYSAQNDFLELASELKIDEAEDIDHSLAERLIEESLVHIGADKQGWVIRRMSHGANLAISAPKKEVLIGKHFNPKNSLRLRQVVAHEVYGHVLRSINSEHQPKFLPTEEEGIAIVCEQLLAPSYSHKRLIRFMLVSAGWGVDGNTERTFNDVYEIAWRLYCIIGGATEDEARSRAFYECARVFRGGKLDGGGSILLKDAGYLTSNQRIWRLMSEDPSITIQKLLMV